MIRHLAFVAILLVAQPCLAQPTEQMNFRAVPPQDALGKVAAAWDIYADGRIDADAGARLDQLIEQRYIPPKSMVILSSPGGSLGGAIALGEVIRRRGLFTKIGRYAGEPPAKPTPGECYSGCPLAFIGANTDGSRKAPRSASTNSTAVDKSP
jgi:hypothetical protein